MSSIGDYLLRQLCLPTRPGGIKLRYNKNYVARAEKRKNPGSDMVSRKCSIVHNAATSIESARFFCQVPMVRAVTMFQVDKRVRESATLALRTSGQTIIVGYMIALEAKINIVASARQMQAKMSLKEFWNCLL